MRWLSNASTQRKKGMTKVFNPGIRPGTVRHVREFEYRSDLLQFKRRTIRSMKQK